MNKRIAVAFLLLFGSMFAFIGTQDGSSRPASAQEKVPLSLRPAAPLDCSFISPLDSYIQKRFTQEGRGFGIERIIIHPRRGLHTPVPSLEPTTIGRFGPENDQEREAVAEIERSGLKMALYLASRSILRIDLDKSENKDIRMALHGPLRGPVAITEGAQKTDWPEKPGLWKQARKAMQDFDSDKSASHYEFSLEGKDFIARPVRAQESCLQCHTPGAYQSSGHDLSKDGSIRRLNVGDPIGVLLYAYIKSTKSTNVKIP